MDTTVARIRPCVRIPEVPIMGSELPASTHRSIMRPEPVFGDRVTESAIQKPSVLEISEPMGIALGVVSGVESVNVMPDLVE